ncbi:glycosyltransferase family 2 protein [Clostridium disporicum]|uniref:Glycosyltransferase n=1 Tax=Clostridium disporicum TaxID=84024 RepID=A0A174KYR1_9CLOT|nr:glycosyltransferase family 2 protein [Clostridium disporicum]CUP17444.1 glycosyltransferase [Clostridium disporicum]
MSTKNVNYTNEKLFEECMNKNILDSKSYENLIKQEKYNKIKLMQTEITETQNKISIIIPTYNRRLQLLECINSILKQTYKNFEIIVVDDCSTDETEEYISKLLSDNRIKYLKNLKNSGPGYSRKVGFEKSSGEFIIFCDDDDYYIDSNYFTDAINIFKDGEISLICSNTFTHFEKENTFKFLDINFDNTICVEEYLENFQYKYMKPNSTFSAIFRKNKLVNGDLKNMKMVNDSSIYMRGLISGGKVFVNRKIIGVYRVHSQNITLTIKADFIIENLKEKKYIYERIVENKLFNGADKWLSKQIEVTFKYLLWCSNPTRKEINKIFNWILKNTNKNINLIIKLWLYRQFVRLRNMKERFM